jgi:hypothetical protein
MEEALEWIDWAPMSTAAFLKRMVRRFHLPIPHSDYKLRFDSAFYEFRACAHLMKHMRFTYDVVNQSGMGRTLCPACNPPEEYEGCITVVCHDVKLIIDV